MSVIIILIGASLMVAGGFLVAFIWSVKSDQFEDIYTPSVRILMDGETTALIEEVENHMEESKIV